MNMPEKYISLKKIRIDLIQNLIFSSNFSRYIIFNCVKKTILLKMCKKKKPKGKVCGAFDCERNQFFFDKYIPEKCYSNSRSSYLKM